MTRARESPASQVRGRSGLRRGLRCVGTRARTRGGRSKYSASSAELPLAGTSLGDAGLLGKWSSGSGSRGTAGSAGPVRGFYKPTEIPQLRDTVPDPHRNPTDETAHS